MALYLSMGLTFIEQTVLWFKKKEKEKEVTKRQLTLTTSSPPDLSLLPHSFLLSAPLLSSPLSPSLLSLHPGTTHITTHYHALHCI